MTGYLDRLVAASSSLTERVEGPFTAAAGAPEGAGADPQLARWKAMFTDAGPDAFARRLSLDGWTEAMVAPYLGEVGLPSGEGLPSWASLLGGCVDAMLATTPDDPRDDVRPGRPPRLFEQVFSPALRFASAELQRRSPTTLRLLSATALTDAETALLESLVQVSAATLTLEFQAFRSVREPTLFRVLRRITRQRSSELYRDFLTGLRGGDLLDLVSTYPVLGRLWGRLVETWIQTLTEMVERLDRDRALLHTRLGVCIDDPALDHLTMAMSDRHHGGRSVLLLTFRGGEQIIYKPKGLGLEEAFSHLLDWLNQRGAPVRLRGIEVVDRGTYGWVEFVAATGCEDRPEVAAYYRRAGGLLCLVHLLEGTDCHLENIVAAGPDPVLVDAEALLHHRKAEDSSAASGDDVSASQQHRRSVLRTGLLPTWTLDRDGNPVDTSGLGGFGDQATARQFLGWENVNTDEMQFGQRPGRLPQAGNVPSLGGVPQSPLDFQHELISGFTQMYRFCQQEKPLLTGPDSPLHAFAPQTSRFIARDSALYGWMCAGLVQPLALTSGIEQTLQLEALAVGYLTDSDTSDGWPLVREELATLQELDIPYFSVAVSSADLDLPTGGRLPSFFEGASLDTALRKISNTSAADLRDQARYIEATLFSRATEQAHLPELNVPECAASAQSLSRKIATLDAGQFVAEAERLAQQIFDEAIRSDAGGVSWLGLDYQMATRRYRYQPLGYGLYSGRGGIGVFLAALWSVTGEQRWRELAYAAVAGLRWEQTTTRPVRWPVAEASTAYALARMGGLLRDQDLVQDAARLATRIPITTIESDEAFDVLSGCAGALLSFLLVHRCSGASEMLDRAVDCGERLADGRVPTPTGHRAWARHGALALTGFSHGAAGCAYALLRLFEATGKPAFRETALEAMAFERATFDAAAGNWPDFRSGNSEPAESKFMTAWCHGATGIGLSRLKIGGLASDGAVPEEVEVALAATRRARGQQLDQLCCGSFGRIELLLTAGIELDRPELVAEARQWATSRVREARHNQAYGLMSRLPRGVRSYGFFQGTSGIGYELLRLAQPAELPVVLLWE